MLSDADFYDLLSHGKYDDIIDIISNIEKVPDRLLLFKSEALIYLGHFDAAKTIVNSLVISDAPLIQVDSTRQIALINWSLGKLSKAETWITKAQEHTFKLNLNELQDKIVKAHVSHTFGTICQSIGRLDESQNHLLESLQISTEINNKARIAATLANLGIVASYKGQQNQTFEYYNKALTILRELGKSGDEALVLSLLADSYWENGNADEGINKKMDALKILQQNNNYYRIVDTIMELIHFLVISNRLSEAQNYYDEIVKINYKVKTKNIILMMRFSEALILKFSPRIREKTKALDIFEELLTEELDFEMRSQCVLHLCDLLIDELRIYSEPLVFDELTKLSNQVYQMAQDQKNLFLTVETLILKGKLELINSNFSKAEKIFENAAILANEKGFDFLTEKANLEIKQIQENIEEWMDLVAKGSTFKERIERSKIQDYIDSVLSIYRS